MRISLFLNFAMLTIFVLGGCALYPKHNIEKPSDNKRAPVCVDISFERYRDAFWSSGMSEFPIDKADLRAYRDGLLRYGIYTECPNPVAKYLVKMDIHSGIKAFSIRTYWGIFSLLTVMVVPVRYDISYDLQVNKLNAPVGADSKEMTQWGSLFLLYESGKRSREYKKDYGVPDVGFASIIADMSRLIRADLENSIPKI